MNDGRPAARVVGSECFVGHANFKSGRVGQKLGEKRGENGEEKRRQLGEEVGIKRL
jgi:hypothetical protein